MAGFLSLWTCRFFEELISTWQGWSTEDISTLMQACHLFMQGFYGQKLHSDDTDWDFV